MSLATALRQAEVACEGASRDDMVLMIANLIEATQGRNDDGTFNQAFPVRLGLSAMQSAALSALYRRNGQVIDRDDLTALLYQGRDHPGRHNIDMVLRRVRQKISTTPWRIRSLYGVGYYLERIRDD